MEQKNFLEHVAGLRGLAILCIVFYHMYGEGIWAYGYLGVDVFLVITGYLLFRKRIDQTGGTMTWHDSAAFLGRRIQRIVPSMLVIILGTIITGTLLMWWDDLALASRLGYAACLARANLVLKGVF